MVIDAFGGLEKLHEAEVPDPTAQRGEVVVRVQAAGVGIWDSLQRSGEPHRRSRSSRPCHVRGKVVLRVE